MIALLLTLRSILRRRSPAPVRMVWVELPLNISIPTAWRRRKNNNAR